MDPSASTANSVAASEVGVSHGRSSGTIPSHRPLHLLRNQSEALLVSNLDDVPKTAVSIEPLAWRNPMPSALPAHDRVADALLEFIHSKATSISDEIARAESALRALPEVTFDEIEPGTVDACLFRKLNERLEALRALSSLRTVHEPTLAASISAPRLRAPRRRSG